MTGFHHPMPVKQAEAGTEALREKGSIRVTQNGTRLGTYGIIVALDANQNLARVQPNRAGLKDFTIGLEHLVSVYQPDNYIEGDTVRFFDGEEMVTGICTGMAGEFIYVGDDLFVAHELELLEGEDA